MSAPAIRRTRATLAALFEEIDALRRMTVAQLRRKYFEVFGEQSRSHNIVYLRKRIQYGLQELGEGRSLSDRARARIAELASNAPVRYGAPRARSTIAETTRSCGAAAVPTLDGAALPGFARDPRLPPAGTTLRRVYKSAEHTVIVQERECEYGGKRFTSLSGVARAITGSHKNGFDFFDLGKVRTP